MNITIITSFLFLIIAVLCGVISLYLTRKVGELEGRTEQQMTMLMHLLLLEKIRQMEASGEPIPKAMYELRDELASRFSVDFKVDGGEV